MDRKASEQINDIISRNTDNSVIITDGEGYTTWVNYGFTKLTGYNVDEIIGKKPGELLQGPNTDKKTKTLITEAIKAEKEFVCEILNYTRNKRPYWIELRIFPFDNTEGETNFFGISIDISNKVLRKSPETESENIHKILLENSSEVITLHELDGRVIYASPSCKKVMGYSQEEIIGDILYKHLPKEDRQRIKLEAHELTNKGIKPPNQTFRFIRKDGKVIWLESSVSIINDGNGNPSKIQALARDVTDNVKLIEDMQFQSNILKNISDTVITCDKNGMVNYWSKSAEKLHGMKAEDVIGKPISTFDPVFDFKDFKKNFKKFISTPMRHSWEFVKNDKEKIWIDTTVTALQDEDGNFTGGIGVGKNITELIESKLRLDIAVESADLGLWDHNVIEGSNFVNERWCSMLNYTKDEVDETQTFFKEHMHSDDRYLFHEGMEKILRDKKHTIDITFRMRNKNGNYQWINGKGKAIEFSDDGSPIRIIGTHQDISKQIELTNLLKETNELADVGGWQVNTKTNHTIATDGIRNIFGINNPEEVKLNTFKYFHTEDRKLLESKYFNLLKTGEGYDIELQLTDENGNEKWVRSIAKSQIEDNEVLIVYGAMQDITLKKRMEERLNVTGEIAKVGGWEINELTGESFLTDHVYDIYGLPKGTPVSAEEGIKFYHPDDLPIITEAYTKLVEEGTPYNIEVRFIDANGKHKWVRTMGRSEKVDGKNVRTYGSFQDITKMKQYQERLKELNLKLENKVKERTSDLEQSNQELRTFNYMISHDLRTPLRAVSIFTNELKKKIQSEFKDNNIPKEIDLINLGVNEMNRLITDLLEFAKLRNSKLNLEKTDIKPLINNYFKEAQTSYNDIDAEIKIDKLPILEVDKTLFAHLLSNIIGNAFKYSNGKKLKIHIQYKKGKSHYLLKVKDNGMGFDSKNAKNIFNPFKRLVGHNHSEGSGLGLSICNRIVQQHGGKIWAKSEKGDGAEFYIELPYK